MSKRSGGTANGGSKSVSSAQRALGALGFKRDAIAGGMNGSEVGNATNSIQQALNNKGFNFYKAYDGDMRSVLIDDGNLLEVNVYHNKGVPDNVLVVKRAKRYRG